MSFLTYHPDHKLQDTIFLRRLEATYEAVQFIEPRGAPEPEETILGEEAEEMDAVALARMARNDFMTNEADEYAWWIVRKPGARLANFIADTKSDKKICARPHLRGASRGSYLNLSFV